MTRYLLLFTGILSALSRHSYAISCRECSSTGSTSCTGTIVSCAPNFVCMSLSRTHPEEKERTEFTRKCGDKHLCGKSGVFAITNQKHKFSITCCESDGCTPPIPNLPLSNNTENGKNCPYCVSTNDRSCSDTGNMVCTGDENICGLFKMEASVEPYGTTDIVRGCVSKGFCDLGTWTMKSKHNNVKVEAICDASTALYSALTLLILPTASLILNVF
ncbi:phospholipase A2 inhibitor and Ly6/PLAUR domain-containing protein-like [Aquarana catesbeiana]|uniref:phospholipase A2 inhibitor and Ly6/PLAUR domain-containing protein-like n=1 Tax=Aquarana catesbeiana TaxID=8400 RepID=UPI003CC99CD0